MVTQSLGVSTITVLCAGVIHTIPVYDGFTLSHAMQRQNIAGRTLSHWLAEMLSEVGVELMTVADLQVVKRIKEELCRVCCML